MNALKKCAFPLMVIILAMHTGSTARAADSYAVDPVHSFVAFTIGHLDIGYVMGSFTELSGMIVADKSTPEKSSVEITVAASSVYTHVDKRDEDLRSKNFLDVAEFPSIRFKSTRVKKIDEKTYNVTGDMALHGVTKEITVTVHFVGEGKDPWGGYRMAFTTDFDILRSDYGMNKEIPAAGDKVHLSLSIEAVKQAVAK